MTTEYSFIETFSSKAADPDIFDYVGTPVAGVDQLFVEIGKIGKAIQENTLTAAEAQSTKAVLQSFSDGLNKLNARLAGALVGNSQDAKFKAAFNGLIQKANQAVQQLSYAADEASAGKPIGKLTEHASSVLKVVGGVLGLFQIGKEFWDNGLTAIGNDKAGEKALGILVGLAGGEAGALALGTLAVG